MGRTWRVTIPVIVFEEVLFECEPQERSKPNGYEIFEALDSYNSNWIGVPAKDGGSAIESAMDLGYIDDPVEVAEKGGSE